MEIANETILYFTLLSSFILFYTFSRCYRQGTSTNPVCIRIPISISYKYPVSLLARFEHVGY